MTTPAPWRAIVAPVSQGGLLGAPFCWGARGPDAFDCWGLVLEVLRRRGEPIPLDWTVPEGRSLETVGIMESESHAPHWRHVEDWDAGDVIALSQHSRIHHIGAMTPWGVIHCARGVGVVIQDRNALRRSGYRRLEAYRYAGESH
jgi:hypothetical protein